VREEDCNERPFGSNEWKQEKAAKNKKWCLRGCHKIRGLVLPQTKEKGEGHRMQLEGRLRNGPSTSAIEKRGGDWGASETRHRLSLRN